VCYAECMFLRESLTLSTKKFISNSKRNFVPDKLMVFSVRIVQQNTEICYVGKTDFLLERAVHVVTTGL